MERAETFVVLSLLFESDIFTDNFDNASLRLDGVNYVSWNTHSNNNV